MRSNKILALPLNRNFCAIARADKTCATLCTHFLSRVCDKSAWQTPELDARKSIKRRNDSMRCVSTYIRTLTLLYLGFSTKKRRLVFLFFFSSSSSGHTRRFRFFRRIARVKIFPNEIFARSVMLDDASGRRYSDRCESIELFVSKTITHFHCYISGELHIRCEFFFN